MPADAEDYVHRVGRTARAELTGVALTFINNRDVRNFRNIETLIGSEIHKLPLPSHLGPGPEYPPSTYSRSGYSVGKGHQKGRDKFVKKRD